MPVIRRKPVLWSAPRSRGEMRAQLVEELQGGSTNKPRPVIFEIPIDEGNSYHVIVVWDLWEGIPPDVRMNIVEEAYEQLDLENPQDEPMSSKITIAIGATPEEALGELKLLPFRINGPMSFRRPDPTNVMDDPDSSIRESVERAGGFECDGHYCLAYPTREMADEASANLSREHPEKDWPRTDMI